MINLFYCNLQGFKRTRSYAIIKENTTQRYLVFHNWDLKLVRHLHCNYSDRFQTSTKQEKQHYLEKAPYLTHRITNQTFDALYSFSGHL